jgi:hypothetical protein
MFCPVPPKEYPTRRPEPFCRQYCVYRIIISSQLCTAFCICIIYVLKCLKYQTYRRHSKCHHLKKDSCKGTLRQVFICLRPPSLQGFRVLLCWSSNFTYRQICTCTYSHRERGGGGVEPEIEERRGARGEGINRKAGSKIPT